MGHIPKDARWYLADLVMEITVSGAIRNVVHRNLTLIRADSPEQAYLKATRLGQEAETSYENPERQWVEIKFRGIAQLDVVYEELEDGAELKFEEQVGIPSEEIERGILPKEQLRVFLPSRDPERKRDPDYRSQEVLDEVAERFGLKPGDRKD